MQYVILATETESDFADREDPEASGPYWAAWAAYLEAINASGVLVHCGGLAPPHAATTVHLRDGERHVQDGPFADSKEQLGGYFLIDVADLDAALEWAARCPSAIGASVEVRPTLTPPYR